MNMNYVNSQYWNNNTNICPKGYTYYVDVYGRVFIDKILYGTCNNNNIYYPQMRNIIYRNYPLHRRSIMAPPYM